ncbi:MAG: protein kinase [Acidobacteria bacterium]|nr:protein kinase [Acidobacteriota bacterium]
MNPQVPTRSAFFWFACLTAGFVFLLQLSTIGIAATGRNRPASLGVYWVPSGDGWVAASIDLKSQAHGRIRKGDQLVAIDGDMRAAYLGVDPYLIRFQPGRPVRLSLVSQGAPLLVEIVPVRSSFSIWFLVQNICFSLLTLVVALASLQRPGSTTARWMFGCSALVALIFCRQTLQMLVGAYQGSLERAVAFAIYSVYPLHFCASLQFLSNFPLALPQPRFWVWARRGVWVFGFMVWLEGLGRNTIWLTGLDVTRSQLMSAAWVQFYDRLIIPSQPFYSLIAYCLMAGVLVHNYRALRSVAERRRIRLTAVGLAAIACSLLMLAIVRRVVGAASPANVVVEWVQPMMVALGPPLLAYAVLSNRVIGVRFAIRRGIQYLLALNVLRLVLLSPALVLGAEAVASPPASFGGFIRQTHWGTHLFILGGAAAAIYLRRRIQTWIDRKFFRTAYSQERLLLALIEQVKNADSITEVSQMVAHQLDAALHPKSLYIFYRKNSGDGFSIGYPEDIRGGRALQLLLDRRVFERLDTGESKPFILPPSGTTTRPSLDAAGQEPVFGSEASLVVPMMGPDQRVSGVLWLDEKMSEEPYSARDQALLQTVAAQVGMVYENLQLKEQLQAEQRVRLSVMGRLDAQSMNLLKECLSCGRCYDRTIEHCTVDGAALSMTVPVDRVVDKKYRLDRRLGAGGMGTVYEALDLRLNRVVAVKVMVGRLFGNRAAVRRFEREARTSARLSHPNIVTIHDFGPLEGDGAYLVMEHLKGNSWRRELSTTSLRPAADLAAWFVQCCRAISTAHAAGVVHRDLKPENIMVTPRHDGPPLITILDFGLAKAREAEWADSGAQPLPESRSDLTATGVVMGTLRYMAPEQLSGQEADGRSDIYSITLILVETLFGSLPPRMREMDSWLDQALARQAELNPGWDHQPLAQALKRGLARQPQQRYQTAADLEQGLAPHLASAPEFRPSPSGALAPDADITRVHGH